jgi:hypothetical protein
MRAGPAIRPAAAGLLPDVPEVRRDLDAQARKLPVRIPAGPVTYCGAEDCSGACAPPPPGIALCPRCGHVALSGVLESVSVVTGVRQCEHCAGTAERARAGRPGWLARWVRRG